MIHRLKTRLALANFKRINGFERYDLYTLESDLLRNQIKKHTHNEKKKHDQHEKHRYYPRMTSSSQHGIKRSINTAFSPISPTQQFLTLRFPISEKRSTSPQQRYKTAIPSDEDAANVLVMLRNMSHDKPTSSFCI
ncbi:hypothetical protein [Parasitella parasitica]|uniref:Uncharacterized protein n=1 Tax=Parasitella parasitica TaxID=35722 RepID=A0A0B7MYA3_9FUNG|nr:hypothetical protein [Parasitella parasitica]